MLTDKLRHEAGIQAFHLMVDLMQSGKAPGLDDEGPATGEAVDLIREHPLSGELVRGAFFNPDPKACQSSLSAADFEDLGDRISPLVMRLRYLPTAETVAMVADSYGERGSVLMQRWLDCFEPAGGLQAVISRFSRRTGSSTVATDAIRTALLIRDGLGRAREALHLANAQEDIDAGSLAARSRAQHVMEDAHMMTSLVLAKAECAFWAEHGGEIVMIRFGTKGRAKVKKLGAKDALALRTSYSKSNPYWQIPAFLRHCGRTIVEATDLRHLCFVLYDMALQGHRKAFVKHCTMKQGTWVVDELDKIDGPVAALAAIQRVMGLAFFRLQDMARAGGQYAAYTVQTFAPFCAEHRFFVVRGKIVASTPSDRDLSVLDAQHGRDRLDPRIAILANPANQEGPYDRGRTSSRESRRDVAAMARLVRRFLQDAMADPETAPALPHAFVVDAGLGPDGAVGLVEINTLRNAGLYSADCDRIGLALRDAANWPERKDPEIRTIRFVVNQILGGPDGMQWQVAQAGGGPGTPEISVTGEEPEEP